MRRILPGRETTTPPHPDAAGETCSPRTVARQNPGMALLPPRPLRLDSRALAARRLKKMALNALVAGVGLAFSVGALFLTRELLGERALWDRGGAGRPSAQRDGNRLRSAGGPDAARCNRHGPHRATSDASTPNLRRGRGRGALPGGEGVGVQRRPLRALPAARRGPIAQIRG